MSMPSFTMPVPIGAICPTMMFSIMPSSLSVSPENEAFIRCFFVSSKLALARTDDCFPETPYLPMSLRVCA
ncbi:MAG: hypothetical protein HYW27_02275 [Candidatus Aenigmarchaeota archaeon]|nr:hypothetical protein [Candidatus Aenigmarchaeota archaeon]